MSYFPDLSGDIRKKVGWLEGDHPVLTGPVSDADIAKLEQLVLHSWKPPFGSNGWHDCSLCPRQPGDGPIMYPIGGKPTLLGGSEMFIPAGDVLYEAPTLIIHYICDHHYQPPAVFLAALHQLDWSDPNYGPRCATLWQQDQQLRAERSPAKTVDSSQSPQERGGLLQQLGRLFRK